MVFLDASQIMTLAEEITNPPIRRGGGEHRRPSYPERGLLVRFASVTGLRAGEVVALRTEAVDLLHGRVQVLTSATEAYGKLHFGLPKTYQRRAVPIPQALVAELTAQTKVSYNPVASAWKGNGVAQALEFASRGVQFGLGTDATRMDGFRLIDAAETAQRLTTGLRIDDWVAGRGRLWVDAATVNGAVAGGLGTSTGAIEPGRRADYLILDTTAPECRPSWDFTWELVRFYDRSHLRAVYVDGEQLLLRGRPTGWDLDAFLDDSEPIAQDVIRKAKIALIDPAGVGLR